ncbi:MAG: argininosuccinate lyase, partial [Desulfovibrionaceae bacterium]|nr:argininosuccinate lyase [Desulfovibrionaceae bacterium]
MKTNQSWGGRFQSGPAEIVAQFTDSQSYDRALYAQDIQASKAHARMLGRQNIITDAEAQTLVDGLDQVLKEIEQGTFEWRPEIEDVHMNIEARLTALVGDVGKKLHTARSRNDQVGLTFRLYVSQALDQWEEGLKKVIKALVERAKEEQNTILPGCTHLQPAQPVSLSHYLLAYAFMLRRDCLRLNDTQKRVKTSPLGAAALAGTTYPLDPKSVADEVGFNSIYENSLDAVSDRDFVIEAQAAASMIMMHLSRLCEEIILWANPNFGYVKLPDTYSTGSSIMPQKKNPDVAELIRGKTGRVYGALTGILTLMKGLPLAYNRDLQEDKEGFLDTHKTIIDCLKVME